MPVTYNINTLACLTWLCVVEGTSIIVIWITNIMEEVVCATEATHIIG